MNAGSIRPRLDVLLDALADLRRYREDVPRERLLSDRDAQHMVLHALYEAAQASIDVALHVAARLEGGTCATYQETFTRLGEAGVLPRDLALRMRGWAGLRNVLAHQYAAVDHGRIADVLRHELGDLERFASAITAAIADDG